LVLRAWSQKLSGVGLEIAVINHEALKLPSGIALVLCGLENPLGVRSNHKIANHRRRAIIGFREGVCQSKTGVAQFDERGVACFLGEGFHLNCGVECREVRSENLGSDDESKCRDVVVDSHECLLPQKNDCWLENSLGSGGGVDFSKCVVSR